MPKIRICRCNPNSGKNADIIKGEGQAIGFEMKPEAGGKRTKYEHTIIKAAGVGSVLVPVLIGLVYIFTQICLVAYVAEYRSYVVVGPIIMDGQFPC